MRWIAQPVIALGLVFSVLSAAFAAAEPDPAALDSLARLARQWNSFGRHAEAEIAYRRALEIKLLQSPADDPALADILMPLAMEVSNQGRFREARALFAEAEWLVNHSTDPFDKPRLIAYRAIDAMNQHHFSQARDFARTAMEMRQTLAGSASGKSTVVNGVLARGELAHSLLIEAQASLQMNDLLAAEVASTRALEILAASSAPPASWRSEALLVLGEVNGRMARSEKAETLLKEGVS
ncbi:MAG TPA: hypothetical protein HPP80_03740, partial [Rhodospirillaceae bacterium]|nr:hypothetical protein [Rhodospirillaceae bacterium]